LVLGEFRENVGEHAQIYSCHSERSEESVNYAFAALQILHYVQNDRKEMKGIKKEAQNIAPLSVNRC
jgi:hypothetical protein